MADNDNKIVVNVPGQDNVDPSEVTQSSPAFDPLTGRDTDTGSLNKLNDTRTRKTIKLKPTGSTPTVPVINIDSESVPTESTPISDVIAGRDTETGGLDRLNDTRTRKTVKLAPLSPPGVPKITIGVPPAPSGAPAPISLKPVVAPPINLSPVPPAAAEAPSMTNTDTGSLQTLNDTNTRKTVKLSPAPLTPAPAINIAAPAVEPEPLMTNTDTGSLQMLDDTKTRKAIKLSPTPVGPTTAETMVLTPPPPAPVPIQQLKPITPPQPLKPVIPVPAPAPTMVLAPQPEADTTTSAVKRPEAAPEVAIELQKPDDASPMPVAEDDDTIKLQRKTVAQNGSSAPTQSHSDISPLPTVAAAKTVPGSKQTIKLRPSSGGTAAPDEVKKPTEPPKIAEASKPSARDTIKLSPTAAPAVAPTLAPSPAVTPSAPTINLTAPTPPPAPAVTPSAPTVNLKAPTPAPAVPPPVAPTPVAAPPPVAVAPAVEVPPPPKQTLSLKPKLPTVPTVAPAPPVVAPTLEKPEEAPEMAPANEGEEAPEAPKKGGLKIGKKQGGDEAAFVPPSVQKGIDDMAAGGGPKITQGMSKLYTAVAAVTVLCLIATTYITAAQYVNLWQQAKVKTKLPVPFLQKNK